MSNRIFVSVVSHGHGRLIEKIGSLEALSGSFTTVVKLNKGEFGFREYLESNSISYIDENYYQGFGENNNQIFNYLTQEHNIDRDDYILLLNPDVNISVDEVTKLLELVILNKYKAATVNLFRDDEFTDYDPAVRKYPKLFDFISSFLGFGNPTILDKSSISKNTVIDWCAGSFILIRADLYSSLRGFDEKYFMYCEDLDLCYRLKNSGSDLIFIPSVKAIHYGKHGSRNIFSKHFYWHVKSIFRFLVSTKFKVSVKSSVGEIK
ncbi:glycosyl transferase family 2 [Pseudoalteromonas aurantia]|uniref:glycosyltransferase family 2 protein n=1 Tax=Pseudoalteromonas aurantia TaxID=43654 RepID=UPI00110B2845|nr:glycosyltransferase family 2 protein [Pseudoalteromonas aurantia]TMO67060.1 glycosyl transferase family 2 [Pseudoalteromonas aurantia]